MSVEVEVVVVFCESFLASCLAYSVKVFCIFIQSVLHIHSNSLAYSMKVSCIFIQSVLHIH